MQRIDCMQTKKQFMGLNTEKLSNNHETHVELGERSYITKCCEVVNILH